MQFSLKTLLAYTLLVAAGCYAVLYPSDWIARAMQLLQLPLAAGSITVALLATGKRRAYWTAFAAFFVCSHFVEDGWRGHVAWITHVLQGTQFGYWTAESIHFRATIVHGFVARITLATVAGLVTQVIYARAAKRSEQA